MLMTTYKKPLGDEKKPLDDHEDKDIINEFLEGSVNANKHLVKIIELINQNPDFTNELQAILAKFRNSNLIHLQTEILLLLQEVLNNFVSGKYSIDDDKKLDGKQREKMNKRLGEMSQALMQQNILQTRIQKKQAGVAKDKYEYLTPETYSSLKTNLKKFVVYEMYKVLSPKRIAGESHRDNFITNAVMRGIKVAIKYEPKVAHDMEKSSPGLIPEIERQHKQVKSNKGLEL